MSSIFFSILFGVATFIIAIVLYLWIEMLDYSSILWSICISIVFGGVSFFITHFKNVNIPSSSIIIMENYMHNSFLETSDKIIEEYIEEIFESNLGRELRYIDVSSCTYDKAYTRVIKINISIGENVYSDYNYEYVLNLKTKTFQKNG